MILASTKGTIIAYKNGDGTWTTGTVVSGYKPQDNMYDKLDGGARIYKLKQGDLAVIHRHGARKIAKQTDHLNSVNVRRRHYGDWWRILKLPPQKPKSNLLKSLLFVLPSLTRNKHS